MFRNRSTCFALMVVCGLVASVLAQEPTFYEHDGVVVVEVESVPPASNWFARTGDYVITGANTVSGYTGSACYQFEGNVESGGSVNGIMTYNIHIQNSGTYRLNMRTMEANPETNEGDKGNDCYVKMVGQDGCEGNFTKYVWLGAAYEWGWSPRLECSHHTFSDPVYELSAGTHQFQIAGRSKNFIVDRFSLIMEGSSVNGTDIDLVESPTDPSVTPLPITLYNMRGLDFPYSGTGYVRQSIWISLDASSEVRQATVSDIFAHASGAYNIRLYCVAENLGRSSYRVWVGDNLLGTYTVPLTDQGTELGIDFRAAWDGVTVNSGDEITVEANAGTLDNAVWTRAGWQKLTFMPQFDPNDVATDEHASRTPARRSSDLRQAASAYMYTLDGRRVVSQGAGALRSPRGVYIQRSPQGIHAVVPCTR